MKTGLVVACAVGAAAAWVGLRPDAEESPPPEPTPRAVSSPSEPASSGDLQITNIRLSSRRQLLDEVAALGFDRVMVLTIGRPVRFEHYATDHLHLRMTYATGTGEVRLFQSNDQGITSGASVMIRGVEGVRNGDGVSWVEHGHIFDLNPLKRRYVRALRWVASSDPSSR